MPATACSTPNGTNASVGFRLTAHASGRAVGESRGIYRSTTGRSHAVKRRIFLIFRTEMVAFGEESGKFVTLLSRVSISESVAEDIIE
jgi:hypothetical protein